MFSVARSRKHTDTTFMGTHTQRTRAREFSQIHYYYAVLLHESGRSVEKTHGTSSSKYLDGERLFDRVVWTLHSLIFFHPPFSFFFFSIACAGHRVVLLGVRRVEQFTRTSTLAKASWQLWESGETSEGRGKRKRGRENFPSVIIVELTWSPGVV